MAWEPISKTQCTWRVAPNLQDYEQARAAFCWGQARRELDGLPRRARADEHRPRCGGPPCCRPALRPRGTSLARQDWRHEFTYAHLRDLSNRFANVLDRLGVAKVDRVCVLAGRIPELYITALGTLKNRSIFCPLFSAFGPEPVRARLAIGQAQVLVTTESLYERKVSGLRAALPCLRHVLLVGDGTTHVSGTSDYESSG